MKKVRKRVLSAVLTGLTLFAAIFTSGGIGGGSAEAAKVSSDSVEVESGSNYSYIYASDTGRAMTFRTHWVSSGSKQSVYCTQRSKSFNDDGDYTGAYWYSNATYSEMAYVVYHGCSYYESKADSDFTTGSWVKDYYATQVAIWCIREDYGYDGVAFDDISAISGYEDVYECAVALYKAAKKNAGSDGYGDTVSLSISEPSSTEMKLDSSGTYYKTGWYSISSTGTLYTSSVKLVDAPDGAEIVYEDSTDPGSRFYIRIPVSDARALTSDLTTFQVKVSGTFKRPLVYNYYSEDDGDQNITYLKLLEDENALSDTASVSLSPEETGIEIYKTDSQTGNGVEGAVYGVYSDESCTDLVAELGPTDESGYASVSFSMHQETYYVKEISASEAYLVSTQVNEVTVVEAGTGTVHTTEEKVKGKITVKKADAETGAYAALGSAALKGTVYGLYAAEDIVHPDGTTGVVYAAGELVSSLTIPESGSITFSDLYLGSYYIKEISAPVGYTLDETEYPVTLTYADQETEIIAQSLTVKDQVIRGDLSFCKVREASGDPIGSVVFRIESDTTGESHVLVTDADGSVNTAASVHPHTENTNANDAAVTIDEEGNYVVDESLLDPSAGIWFGLTEDDSITDADDSLGALPYDTYTITELSTSANEGLVLVTLKVTISQDGIVIDLGSVDDPDIPAITTSAADAATGIALSAAAEDAAIIDTVSYIGLTPGETYTVTGILMDRDTGAPLLDAAGSTVTAEQTFQAEKSHGTVDVTYSFDATGLEDVTTVVFETLYDSDGEWVASHEDLEDEGQTICFPEIQTTALDSETGTHEALAEEEVTIIDTVSYSNLIIGKEYTVSGILYDTSTGEPITDAQGNEVTAQTTFTAEESDGSIEVEFTFDASLLCSKTTVAFETLTYEEKTVAVHADLTDEGQWVRFPEISTTARDAETGIANSYADEEVTIIDTVSYENVIAGGSYTVSGILMDKTTGAAALDADGEIITAEVTFEAKECSGTVDVTYTFDAAGLAGSSYVVFEELFSEGGLIAVHEDLEDEGQTICFPEIQTTALDSETGTHEALAEEEVTIIDTISYSNLIVGKEYTVSGILYDTNTGEPITDAQGNEVTAQTTFTAEESDGSIEVEFTFDASLLGSKTTVAFETLTYEEKTVAVHADLTDEGQWVRFPEISTTARDAETGIANSYADEEVTIIDTVSYANVTIGETYTVSGILMDKTTGEAALDANGEIITAEATFEAMECSGTVDVTYTFDAAGLAGSSYVVFEELFSEGGLIAVHEDLEDEGQTICFPEIQTTALDSETGTHEALAEEEVTIIDTISYSNLIVGKEYTVSGILYDTDTGEPITDAQGNEVTAQTTFTAEESDGSIETVFTFDASLLGSKTTVAFETLTYEEKTVAVHADLTDEEQSVSLKSLPEETTTAKTDDTGRSMRWILLAAAGLLLLGAAVRKKTKNIQNS